MSPKEWLVGTHLVPADKQLWFWVLEEATHIRWERRSSRLKKGKQEVLADVCMCVYV